MTVYHLSAECYPVAKVGGLGDVVGALPKYQQAAGVDAHVVLPFYDRPFTQKHPLNEIHRGEILMGENSLPFSVLTEPANTLGFPIHFIKIPGLLDRQEVYMYPDEREQFIAFQMAFLQWLIDTGTQPDIVHCHDHHTGLVPFFMYNSPLYQPLAETASVFTVHNGQYQGWMGWDKFALFPPTNSWRNGLIDWNGNINCLAAAIKCCTAFTTVSPGYMHELMIAANELESLFRMESSKGIGILNGIDADVWNPETDKALPEFYGVKKAAEGKKASKNLLCDRFGFSREKPLFSFIGRLVGEKGADLLPEFIDRCLRDFPDQLSFLILGSGEPEIEQELNALKDAFSPDYNVYIGYDEQLSHQIYAGTDFLLMPSRVEPCGLNQLYALRYGTIPVTRRTGGLADTVVDIREGKQATGLNFIQPSVDEMAYTLGRAVSFYYSGDAYQQLQQKNMKLDYSWNSSAGKYIDLYEKLTHR
ncbi:MAG: glycogen/starch synthase [Mucilaginibacter polytrichastri]|nr:glycogen/starch synthase [Mucilaginibacter polytrichastri]